MSPNIWSHVLLFIGTLLRCRITLRALVPLRSSLPPHFRGLKQTSLDSQRCWYRKGIIGGRKALTYDLDKGLQRLYLPFPLPAQHASFSVTSVFLYAASENSGSPVFSPFPGTRDEMHFRSPSINTPVQERSVRAKRLSAGTMSCRL